MIIPRLDAGAPGVGSVRVRLFIAFAGMFALTVVLAGPIDDAWLRPAERAAPVLAVLRLVALAIVVPLVLARLAGGILERVERLDSRRRELEDLYDQARVDALVDPLTGLGNHRAFQEELLRQTHGARRRGGQVALILVDVDDLKRVNDEGGHARGDALLAAIGHIARRIVRGADRAYRIGGDEFAFVLPDADSERAFVVARRLLAAALDGEPDAGVAPFSFSAGISSFPALSPDSEGLHGHADAALYWAKRHGRTDVQIFDPGRHSGGDVRTTPELEAAVVAAARDRTLTAVYQPIFSLETGRPIGFEGLIRPAPGTPFRTTESLFVAAEAAGRTIELDLACLDVVAASAGELPADAYLAVNVSPRTLEVVEFSAAELAGRFRAVGLAPDRLVLEMTEREAVEDLDRLRQNLAACRALGMRLAADDVGAGNAGLRLLSQVHFDIVKIDLTLVQGGVLRESSLGVLRALRELAARWNATIVAEGVETPEQLAVVRSLGFAAAQGYLLGRPAAEPLAAAHDLDAILARAASPLDRVGRADRVARVGGPEALDGLGGLGRTA
jgi:diguanylate cyclase (GGDEF)-like protein